MKNVQGSAGSVVHAVHTSGAMKTVGSMPQALHSGSARTCTLDGDTEYL
jgi:hypothetical protein